jgi:hypothetical protein
VLAKREIEQKILFSQKYLENFENTLTNAQDKSSLKARDMQSGFTK